MIKKLRHKDKNISSEIRRVFQLSYAVEAKLLGAIDFPPLKRPLESFILSSNNFYGAFVNKNLAGVIEIYYNNNSTHIQSLVVDPTFFRKGIASQLMNSVFVNFTSNLFTVETGSINEPAINLYKKYGFLEVNQYLTDHGIMKVRLEKKIT